MNATEVINELERLGGIADQEWHGEKLKLNHCQIEAEVERGVDNSQFEMDEAEEPNSSDDKGLIILDALQRQ